MLAIPVYGKPMMGTFEPGVSRRTAFVLALVGTLALGGCNATDDSPNDPDKDPQNSADASTIGSGPLAGRGGASSSSGKAGQGGAAGRNGNAGASGNAGGGSIGQDAGSAGSAGARGGDGGRSGSAGGAGAAGAGGSCAPCLAASLDWGNSGGLVARSDRSMLSPCNAYRHTRTTFGGGGGAPAPALACDRMLPCMGSGLHGIGDVIAALDHADVETALAKGTVLFGVDSRPLDGQVFEIKVGKSTITVGNACPPPSSSCTPIPPGVNTLAQLLRDIDEEQLNLTPCAGMFD